uniref:Exocyst complex component Sec8 n=1 Tax=Parastrongyloides trichosuri TaxID=131310 RepID=A0A0N4ZN62_PARTI
MPASNSNDNSDSCRLLVNVIRTLTTSASDDQREHEKNRLEIAYKNSGETIDKLIKEHENDVNLCLNTFRRVSTEITGCKERIQNVKNNLQQCKTLLQCRRDDLKKLWMENVEQKQICNILNQINEIKSMEMTIDEYIKDGKFKDAVNLLKKNEILLNGPLSCIEGLDQIRHKVHDISKNLLSKIIDDLLKIIIIEPFEKYLLSTIKNTSQNVIQESELCNKLLQKYKKNDNMKNLNFVFSTSTDDEENLNQVCLRISDSIGALAVFDQVDVALKQIYLKELSLCQKGVQDTISLIKTITVNENRDSSSLFQLIQNLIAQFRESYKYHSILVKELSKYTVYKELCTEIHDKYWESCQRALQEVVSDHLDIWPHRSNQNEKSNDNNRMLFKFSSGALMSSQASVEQGKHNNLVCPADPYNIITIFHLLNHFALEIQSLTKKEPCDIYTFLNSFVMDSFVDKVEKDMSLKLSNVFNNPDVWTSFNSIQSHDVCVLTCVIKVKNMCDQVFDYIKHMEAYTLRFSQQWLFILNKFIGYVEDVYNKITMTNVSSENKIKTSGKISAAWALDEDISRLLKSLPSWIAITAQTPNETTPTSYHHILTTESEFDIKKRNQRESEILIGNLGVQKQIKYFELVTDIEHIKILILLHESLLWFTFQFRSLLGRLSRKSNEIIQYKVPDTELTNTSSKEDLMINILNSKINKIEIISETCLLLIHLELRVHCFYYLYPLSRADSKYSEDENDQEATDFRNDLYMFHKVLSQLTSKNKWKYLFEGLGHLCASIFIHSSQHMNKLRENGRKRLCRNIFAVQQLMSQITGRREMDLDRARSFYELLTHEPDRLLALIVDKGNIFSNNEYSYLLSLAVRSHQTLSAQPGALEEKMLKLREILNNMSEEDYSYSFDWEQILEGTIEYDSGISADVVLSKVYIYDDDLLMAGMKNVDDVDDFVKNYAPISDLIVKKKSVSSHDNSKSGVNSDADPECFDNLTKKELRERRRKISLELAVISFSKYWKNVGDFLTMQTFFNDFKDNLDEEKLKYFNDEIDKNKPFDPYYLIKVHRDPLLLEFSNISERKLGLDCINSLDWDDLYEQHRQLVREQALMDFNEYKRTNIKKAKYVSGFDETKYSSVDRSSDEEKNVDNSDEKEEVEMEDCKSKELECKKGFEEIRDVKYVSTKPEFKLRILSLRTKAPPSDESKKNYEVIGNEEDKNKQVNVDFCFDPVKDKHLIASEAKEYLNLDAEVKKYWNQRFRLFSKLNHGILMDREGWFSVTPEKIAKHIAERMVKNKGIIIMDAFTGVGGNAIQFALKGAYVYAIELDPVRLKCAIRNAEVYGVADRIQFFLGDFFKIVESIVGSRKVEENSCNNPYILDSVFLSPPWGGPNYLTKEVYDLKNDIPIDGFKVFEYAKKLSSNIAYFLPRNTPMKQLISLSGPGGKCEIEHSVLNSKIKTLTAYYGNLLSS